MKEITVNHLVKEYCVVEKEEGLLGACKSILHPQKKMIRALDDISFEIERGETVGYIGANGSGKSTTIKCLIGILCPTRGNVSVGGFNPEKERMKVAQKIGVVFGQRSSLQWDIRLSESFELNKRIYQIPDDAYKQTRDKLVEMLSIGGLLGKPVRQLSLGQRMRGEIVAALLHSPSILFLDEPTVGLDFESRENILRYIRNINQDEKVTVILTSHNIHDIEAVCKRAIIINKGRVIEDRGLQEIVKDFSTYKIIQVEYIENIPEENIPFCGNIIARKDNTVTYRIDKSKLSVEEAVHRLITGYRIKDIKIDDPELEEIVKSILTDPRNKVIM